MGDSGFKYDVNIIYNKANSPLSKTADTELSLRFTERLNEECSGWGIKRTFYYDRDAIPGKNIFTQLKETVDSSRYTVVILTKDFVRDCWAGYKQQWAFKQLLDKKQSHRFLPIAVGLSDADIPENLDIHIVVHFKADWNEVNDETQWRKVKTALQQDQAALEPHIHTEETGDNRTRSTEGHLVSQPSEPHKLILDRCITHIREDLHAERVLALLIEKGQFDYTTIKNIQDEPKPSKMNQQLFHLIRSNGQPAYDAFKECLKESDQLNLLEIILKQEEIISGAGTVDSPTVVPITPADSSLDSPDFGGEVSIPSQNIQGNSTPAVLLYQRNDTTVTSQTLQSVIPNMQGAVDAAAQATAESAHTTNMTRQLSSNQAMLSLETDTSPSADSALMTLESGPKLTAPMIKPPNTQVKSPAQSKEVKPNIQVKSPAQSKEVNSSQQSGDGKLAGPRQSAQSVLGVVSDGPVESEPVNQPPSASPLLSQLSLSQDNDLVIDHTSLPCEATELRGESREVNVNSNAQLLKTEQSEQTAVPNKSAKSTLELVDDKPTSDTSNDLISPSSASVTYSPQISLSQDKELDVDNMSHESIEQDNAKTLDRKINSQERNDRTPMKREDLELREPETNQVCTSSNSGLTTQQKPKTMDEPNLMDSGYGGESAKAQGSQTEVESSDMKETSPTSPVGRSSWSWYVGSLVSYLWQPELAFSALQK